jgi:hypothetical protein
MEYHEQSQPDLRRMRVRCVAFGLAMIGGLSWLSHAQGASRQDAALVAFRALIPDSTSRRIEFVPDTDGTTGVADFLALKTGGAVRSAADAVLCRRPLGLCPWRSPDTTLEVRVRAIGMTADSATFQIDVWGLSRSRSGTPESFFEQNFADVTRDGGGWRLVRLRRGLIVG